VSGGVLGISSPARRGVIVRALDHDRVFVDLDGFVNASRDSPVQRETNRADIHRHHEKLFAPVKEERISKDLVARPLVARTTLS
jgi:hypothetical protein